MAVFTKTAIVAVILTSALVTPVVQVEAFHFSIPGAIRKAAEKIEGVIGKLPHEIAEFGEKIGINGTSVDNALAEGIRVIANGCAHAGHDDVATALRLAIKVLLGLDDLLLASNPCEVDESENWAQLKEVATFDIGDSMKECHQKDPPFINGTASVVCPLIDEFAGSCNCQALECRFGAGNECSAYEETLKNCQGLFDKFQVAIGLENATMLPCGPNPCANATKHAVDDMTDEPTPSAGVTEFLGKI